MKRCSKCGAAMEDAARFCMNCGTPAQDTGTPFDMDRNYQQSSHASGGYSSPNWGYKEPERDAYNAFGTPGSDPYNTYGTNNGYGSNGYSNTGYGANGYGNNGYNGNVSGNGQFNGSYNGNQYGGFQSPAQGNDSAMSIIAYITWIGFIVALIAGGQNGYRSEYLKFHLNQALALNIAALFTFIPVVGWIWYLFVLVCRIISLVGACSGRMQIVPLFSKIRIIN